VLATTLVPSNTKLTKKSALLAKNLVAAPVPG
jgi:hypothetical protein